MPVLGWSRGVLNVEGARMAKLKDIGVGYDQVKSLDKNAIFIQIETWLQSDNSYILAFAIALFAAVLISNRLTDLRRK